MPTFLNVRVIFSFAEFREIGARVERPRACGPRIHPDARLSISGRAAALPKSVSDTNSIVICRAASAAPAWRGRRARRAATDALAGLPVLAIVRHRAPLSARSLAEQRGRIGIMLKSQGVASWRATADGRKMAHASEDAPACAHAFHSRLLHCRENPRFAARFGSWHRVGKNQ